MTSSLSPPEEPVLDRSTQLAEKRTMLGLERTFLAFERSLMAWLRTSLAMISFGFTLAKFFEYLEEQRGGQLVGHFGRTWASDTVGLAMITIGTVALVLAVIQHKRRVDALRVLGLLPQWNLALAVAALVAVLGVLAFGSLLLGR
jgi:putative membrane protein